ncbi:MAG: HPr family phosphocarrier protein [Kiritimatiellae bacterium]|nr:HPr family phosphocarrier protein [Kiritimatiellia bacterium]
MIQTTAQIQNKDGIHCRPSAVIIKAMAGYEGNVLIQGGRSEVPLKSVMGLMTLALLPGDKITITVEGPNEKETAEKVMELFETHFDFPARPDGTKAFTSKEKQK